MHRNINIVKCGVIMHTKVKNKKYKGIPTIAIKHKALIKSIMHAISYESCLFLSCLQELRRPIAALYCSMDIILELTFSTDPKKNFVGEVFRGTIF